jgi:hypothetical protein
MLQIMRVAEDNEVEEFTCAMPRYYAVPLILMNKRLAFFEASCRPDGTPLLPPPPTTKRGEGGGGGGLKDRDLREYAYLWQLRTRFLQAVFDMNHERRLDELWRHTGIHGFVHRMYGRYGHEETQRILYWRDEIKARRVPYTTPDIADMGMCAFFFLMSFSSIATLFALHHDSLPPPFFFFFPSIHSSIPVDERLARGRLTRAGRSIYPREIRRAVSLY